MAHTNIGRAANGTEFDVAQAVSLGPDAVPTLVHGLESLAPSDQLTLRRSLCRESAGEPDLAAYNRASSRADDALDDLCRDPS